MAYTKNYYAVLGIKAPVLQSKQIKAQELKAAYKKALLKAHPDKAAGLHTAEDLSVKPQDGVNSSIGSFPFTIDDVKEAYKLLSVQDEKKEYDTWLLARYNEGLLKFGASNIEYRAAFDKGILPTSFQYLHTTSNAYMAEYLAGLELLDLSDFDMHTVTPEDVGIATSPAGSPPTSVFELGEGAWEEKAEWRRPCRCGSDIGFRITEQELEDAEGKGVGEVLVGCWGCSLVVRVGFAVEQD
jgi:diphthamide biosynthesis protein 4